MAAAVGANLYGVAAKMKQVTKPPMKEQQPHRRGKDPKAPETPPTLATTNSTMKHLGLRMN
jgi:hypothetical protein